MESETVILPLMALDQKPTCYLRFVLVYAFDCLFSVDICVSALARNLLHLK